MPTATLPAARSARFVRFITVPLGLLTFFALSLSQLTSTSPTFDEGFTLLRGYAALRTGYLVPIGHPPLAHWLSALGVVLEPNLPDPRDLNGWYGDKYDDSSRDLLWQRGLNATRLVFLGRLPILLLGLVLGAVTYRWAKDLFGWGAAFTALALHALSPNLLAHSAIATTDLPVAAFYIFTLYRWYRFSQTPSLPNAVLVGLMLGCALATKYSALLLLPTLGLLFLIQFFTTKRLRHQDTKNSLLVYLSTCLLIPLTALLTIWATYGFAFKPYLLSQFIYELTTLQSLASEGHTAYLLGQLSLKGWWYYHPLVLLFKTPLPLLILILLGTWVIAYRLWQKTFDINHWSFVIPAFIYLLATALSSLNVGYRYLLPALPLLHILAASAFQFAPHPTLHAPRSTLHPPRFILYGLLLTWHAVSTFLIAPHFLAYFNELVGPSNGYKVLADSNLDWGQDLPDLAKYLDGRSVHLSYFGMADPAYYGIKSDPLPAWPPPPVSEFSPADPAPGLYAISASNLVGVQLPDPNTFAYFRDLKPLTVVNYSIFVYEVPQHDPITTLAQCTPLILNQVAVNQLFNKRTLRQITYDCNNSLVIPAQPALLLYPADQTPIFDLGSSVFDWKRSDNSIYYHLYKPSRPASNLQSLISNSQFLSLLDYQLTLDSLTLTWLVTQPAPPPVSVFVHFNWPDGALAEAYDALGFPAEQWQVGDVIIQRHPISPDLPAGNYPIVVGLYSLADGTRYSEIKLVTFTKP